MTRARKIDPAALEREYVYDAGTPPISITGLSDLHGMSRSHVADMARRGKWFEKRREVRLTVGEKVLDAMTDAWAETNTAIRNRMLELSTKLLDKAEEALAAGDIKITKVADIATIIAMQRTLLGDQQVDMASKDGMKVIDVDSMSMDPDKLAEMLPLLKRLTAGEGIDGPETLQRHAGDDAPAGPAGTE